MNTPRVFVNPSDVRAKWNSSASTIPFGSAVVQGIGDDSVEIAVSELDVVIGLLANRDLPRSGSKVGGDYQDIQLRGVAVGIAGTGGVNAGARLTVDSTKPGALVEARPAHGVTVALVGLANRSAAEGELFEVELSGPGASVTG